MHVDGSKWFHQTILPNGWGWYNNEQQHYTNRIQNSYVSDGTLKIVAKKETFNDQGHTKNYTSARLNSKFAFTYGVVEIRAKLPTGDWYMACHLDPRAKILMNLEPTGNSKGLALYRGQLVEKLILWNIGVTIKTMSKVPCIPPHPMALLTTMVVERYQQFPQNFMCISSSGQQRK